MAFAPVPKESRNQINDAGRILVSTHPKASDFIWAIDLAERWRACHAYPINTFQSTLRSKTRHYTGDPIVAQRLKRMSTIIDKLKRYPDMNLARMQDIGGVRAIMNTTADVMKLGNEYVNNNRFTHELCYQKDYITHPRSADGYRSLHLVYKYKNPRNSTYDGLRLEMQFRTKKQHLWATAVETMGMVLRQPLKSRRGSQEWLDFFALTSSAFAYQENTALVPRYSHLSKEETFKELAKLEKTIGALGIIDGVSIAAEHIIRRMRGSSYHLLVLNLENSSVVITGYSRDGIEEAEKDYSEAEKNASNSKMIEPVLVSAGSIDRLKSAYPNFFLDMRDFEREIRKILQQT